MSEVAMPEPATLQTASPAASTVDACSLAESLAKLVREVYGEPTAPIPLHAPRFGNAEKAQLCRVMDSTFVSTVGPEITAFEQAVATFTGARHAIATVNGTAALHVALLLAGVKTDDEVLTQPLTFVATCNAIAYCGAHPAFVDVDDSTLGLSADALQEFLDCHAERRDGGVFNRMTGRRLAACMPMHTLGHPMLIDAVAEICRRWQIPLVEDAAEALGSTCSGRAAGTFGLLGALSFNGNKVITTGGGGMIITDDSPLAARARHITTTAKRPHPWRFEHDEIGFNYRMPNLNAALGLAQMEALPGLLKAKRELAERYKQWARQLGVTLIEEPAGAHSNYWLNGIRLPDKAARDQFLATTHAAGILTRPLWEPMHRQPAFNHADESRFPVSENLVDTVVNLPSSAPP